MATEKSKDGNSVIVFKYLFSLLLEDKYELNWISPLQCSLLRNVKMKVAQSCPTLCDLIDYTVHGIPQARIPDSVAFPCSRESSQPRDRTQVSRIAGRFFTSWAQGKSKNTGMGSLSLLQRIFPTQELNQGLLHCRWILYQLSYQGSPLWGINICK